VTYNWGAILLKNFWKFCQGAFAILMKHSFLLIALLLTAASSLAQTGAPLSPYDAVNPFIGTQGFSDRFPGNTSPAATLPFAMISWAPDTVKEGWYNYDDKTIRGFSLTHLSGVGCATYADVPILPWTGQLPSGNPADLAAAFSHDKEQAHPGSYVVQFDNGVRSELTTATRAGIGRFTFPNGAMRTFLIKAGDSAAAAVRKDDVSTVEIRGNDTVAGTVHSGGFCNGDNKYVLYFVAKFSKPFASSATWADGANPGEASITGHRAGASISFPAGKEPLLLKVGISFVSLENAQANLAAEIPGWKFDEVRGVAVETWKQILSRIEAEGGTADERTIFYTGFYHMLQTPTLFNDENGDYIGFDGKVRQLVKGEAQYANYSDWDIYRDAVQFYSLLFPHETGQMMQSLVRDADQSGWLPKWPVANDVTYVMGGDSPAILLSEAYAFGAREFDTRAALKFMLKGATQPGMGPHGKAERPWLDEYLIKGYIAVGDESAASVTLEYANADFAVSRYAEALGDHESAARLLRSAHNWRNLFDPETGFLRPRTPDGKFMAGFDPDTMTPHHTNWDKKNQLGFEEGSTWQYTWMIPYDYADLFQAMGGNDKVLPKLDKFFTKLTGWGVPTFTVDNQPDFCAPYAYVWAGNPWKTQEVIDRTRKDAFSARPNGLPGNDDLGSTSGVYVWNALGMYPVIPGLGGMVLGTPLFPRVVVHLGDGRTLEVLSKGEGIYVQSVKLNGTARNTAWLPVELLSGKNNRLEFTLAKLPSRTWATQPADFPPSFDASGTIKQ